MGDKHDARASLLGYLYQCRYALLAALAEVKTNPSHDLSIERFDDVAFEDRGTPLELIQTKHHATPADLSDKSVDVWKTLLIWMRRVERDPQRVAQTRFLFLTTAAAAKATAFASLRQQHGTRDVTNAIRLLEVAARTSTNATTQIARDQFLRLDSAPKTLFVSSIWVFDQAPNIIDVRDEIETELTFAAPTGKVTTFTDYLEGWWFTRVIGTLIASDDQSIPLSSLIGKIAEIREAFHSDGLPLAPEIEDMEPESVADDDQRLFVRQMRIIALKEKHAAAAAHDYYRAFAQRSRWAREELLLDDEAIRYDRSLCDAWEREVGVLEEELEDADDSLKRQSGRKLFHWSRRYQRSLRNRDELWLSAGSYQMLADRLAVGWHPDFKLRLKSEDSGN